MEKLLDEKLYTVFVSSTFTDLEEEREAVSLNLQKAGFVPRGMELFPASTKKSWDVIEKVLEQCDVYVLIIGSRYGSVSESLDKSYTEREYELAVELGLPVLAFLIAEPGQVPRDKTDKNEELWAKLENFRSRVQKHQVNFWSDRHELAGQVVNATVAAVRDEVVRGWVRPEKFSGDVFRLDSYVDRKIVRTNGYINNVDLSITCMASRLSVLRILTWTRGGSKLTHLEATSTGTVVLEPTLAESGREFSYVYLGRELHRDDPFNISLVKHFTNDTPDRLQQHSHSATDSTRRIELSVKFEDATITPAVVKLCEWQGDSLMPNVPIKAKDSYVIDGYVEFIEENPKAGHSYSIDWIDPRF